jgi:hypothetical protein
LLGCRSCRYRRRKDRNDDDADRNESANVPVASALCFRTDSQQWKTGKVEKTGQTTMIFLAAGVFCQKGLFGGMAQTIDAIARRSRQGIH